MEKNFKDTVKRVAEEVVQTVKTNDRWAIANSLLLRVKGAMKTHTVPDRYERRRMVMEIVPRLVAIKVLPVPSRDVWGKPVFEDVITVDDGLKYEDDKTVDVEGRLRLERGDKVGFYLLSGEELNELEAELTRYIILDVEEIEGPAIGAWYAIGVRGDSPSSAWNSRIQELFALEEREREERLERMRERAEKALAIMGDLGSPKILEITRGGETFPALVFKLNGEDFTYSFWDDAALRRFEERVFCYKSRLEDYHKTLKEIKEIRAGLKPVFKADLVKLYLEGEVLKVPRNLIGKVIGKKGEVIKAISRVAGRRVRIVEIPDVYLQRKPVFWWASMPDYPVWRREY